MRNNVSFLAPIFTLLVLGAIGTFPRVSLAGTYSAIGCNNCGNFTQLENAVYDYVQNTGYTYDGQVVTYGTATPPGTRILVISLSRAISAEFDYGGVTVNCYEFLGCIPVPAITPVTQDDMGAVDLDNLLVGRNKDLEPLIVPPTSAPGGSVIGLAEREVLEGWADSVLPLKPGTLVDHGWFHDWHVGIFAYITVVDSRSSPPEEVKLYEGDIIKVIFHDKSSVELRVNPAWVIASGKHLQYVIGSERDANGCKLDHPNCRSEPATQTAYPGSGAVVVLDHTDFPNGSVDVSAITSLVSCRVEVTLCNNHQGRVPECAPIQNRGC